MCLLFKLWQRWSRATFQCIALEKGRLLNQRAVCVAHPAPYLRLLRCRWPPSLTELDLSANPIDASDSVAEQLAELLRCSPQLASLRLAPSPLADARVHAPLPASAGRRAATAPTASRGAVVATTAAAAPRAPAAIVAAGGLRPFVLRLATGALQSLNDKPVMVNERHFLLAKAQARRAAAAERALLRAEARAGGDTEDGALGEGIGADATRARQEQLSQLPKGMLPPPPPMPATVAAAAATTAAAAAARAAAANPNVVAAGPGGGQRHAQPRGAGAVRAVRPRSAASIQKQFAMDPAIRPEHGRMALPAGGVSVSVSARGAPLATGAGLTGPAVRGFAL